MITAQQEDVVGIFHLIAQKKNNAFDRKVSSINIVWEEMEDYREKLEKQTSKKQIFRIWGKSTHIEQS